MRISSLSFIYSILRIKYITLASKIGVPKVAAHPYSGFEFIITEAIIKSTARPF